MLLGVVGEGGRLAYVTPQLIVDGEVAALAREAGVPEARMRFAQPCVEAKCGHWGGDRCLVIGKMLEFQEQGRLAREGDDLPACSIRSVCRWFAQQGPKACSVCPFVITDLRGSVSDVEMDSGGPSI